MNGSLHASGQAAGELPPTDIAAKLLAVELDPFGDGATPLGRPGDVRADRGDREHPSAGRDEATPASNDEPYPEWVFLLAELLK